MIPLTLLEVAELTGGTVHGAEDPGAVIVSGPVVTDSRECGPGGLYVARVGEHADGHAYAGAARDAGAVAALTSRVVADLPCVVVDDVQTAFGALARGVLDRAPGVRVVGITGSSGKTSTKDLLASVLERVGETVSPVNSLNGEIGVPLTVCRITAATRFLVVEMGARGVGHIEYLTRIAPPDVAVVLNVGSAHVGEFGSRENIARAKGELPAAVGADGLAVLNADDALVAAMAERVRGRVQLVGLAAAADVRAEDVELSRLGRPSFTLVTPAGRARVGLRLSGAHQVGNALSVAAVALELGLSLDQVVAGLEDAGPVSRWRMEISERPDGVVVVNDAYNANPESMRAAIDALAAIHTDSRRWAVLGEMRELGDESEAEHAGVARYAREAGVDRLVGVGEATRVMQPDAWFPDTDAAGDHLEAQLAPGDVVLVKSSRDSGLRWLGERLAAAGAQDPPDGEGPGPTTEPGDRSAPGDDRNDGRTVKQ